MSTILLVEDDRQLATYWREALESSDYRVIHETSFEGAIDVLEENRIDLLITDIMLESKNEELARSGGLAVISYIALNIHPQPKIIATSGQGSRSTFVDYGFRPMESVRTLRKPVSVERLLEAVAEILQEPNPEDLTRPEEYESILHSNQAMLKLLGATDGVWDWKVGSENMEYAPGYRMLLGFDGEDTVGFPDTLDSFSQRIHNDDKKVVWASVNQLLQSQETHVYECRMRDKNDKYIWVRSRASASFNDQGKAVRVVGSTHDITDEVHARQALARKSLEAQQKNDALLELNRELVQAKHLAEESESRFRMIADSAPTIIWLSEPDLTISWANQQLESFTGRGREKFYGTRWADVVDPDNLADFRAIAEHAAKRQIGYQFECRLPRHDDEYLWFHSHCAPRFDARGLFVGFVGIATDIHLSREARLEELEKLNDELNYTNSELEQFAYVASHDLRTPLRGISSIVSFLREDEADTLAETSIQYLDTLEHRVSRMESLLDGLLSYSRAGRQDDSQVGTVEVAKIVEDAIDLLSPPTGFEVNVTTPMPTIRTYTTPLRHIFLNLIGNAIKHHDKDHGQVQIAAEELTDFVKFVVSDNGPGIDPRYHEKIFEIFQRLDGNEQRGSGMGLAIVRRMVRRYGGDITLQTSAAGGTSFIFTWPIEAQGITANG